MSNIESIQKHLNKGEGLIISSGPNRLYFTGFNSSAGLLFITQTSADFLIDFRYFEKASSTIKHCTVTMLENTARQVNELIERYQIKTIYLETSYVTIEDLTVFKEAFKECYISTENTLDKKILALRSIKTIDEINHIKAAQKMTDETFSYILSRIREGRTEREIMLDMEFYLRTLGSEGVAFDFIVVSGKNSSLPHGVPTDKPIENGDFITMDFGAVVNGYRSDMTRTIAIGNISEEQRHVYNTVLEAQKRAFDGIKHGVACKEIDRIARDFIDQSGYNGCFGHGLGHSVGIEIHENPSFNTRDNTTIQEGMVITVEPGIYLPEKFGVRIEDMVYITENGYQNLTHSPKNLIIL